MNLDELIERLQSQRDRYGGALPVRITAHVDGKAYTDGEIQSIVACREISQPPTAIHLVSK